MPRAKIAKISSEKIDRPELLAPAGTIDAFFGALEQGADAIYVGTPRFNARLRARNFSFDELARLIAYAHGIGRRVYVTLNTLVKEDELADLVDTLDTLRRLAPDALIVQDLGVARLARRLMPEIPLHASTQMTVHNLDGALEAERMGFERAIVARELTLDEIVYIRSGAQIELESFVHGAMCYCVSGQCNFSSYVHGKSANRGRCLQPCRRVYDTPDERLPLFAPLDLGAAPVLFQLIKAGIRCFKIEGRLKPAETISRTVAAYRGLIDAYPDMTKDTVEEARENLRLAIGRRQSTGFYLSARPDDTMVGEGMSQSGRYLGKAEKAAEHGFELRPREHIQVGDRLSVQKGRDEAPKHFNVRALSVGRKRLRRGDANRPVFVGSPFPVPEGAAIVKVIDADAATDESKRHEDKKWPKATERSRAVFAARLEMDVQGAATLTTSSGDRGVCIEQWPSYEEHTPLDKAREILSAPSEAFSVRLGVDLQAGDFEGGVPMTDKELQAIRERALAGLERRLAEDRKSLLDELERPLAGLDRPAPQPCDRPMARVGSLEEAVGVLRRANAVPVVPVREASRTDFQAWYEGTAPAAKGRALRDDLWFELPGIDFGAEAERDALHEAVDCAVRAGVGRFVVGNIGHFHLLRATGRRGLEVLADDGLHCLNSQCLAALIERGASGAFYALEGDAQGLRALAGRAGPERLALQVYGKVPLFRSRHPHPSGLREVRTVVPSVEELEISRREDLTWVVPARDFSLRHRLDAIREMGIGLFLYDLTWLASPSHRVRDVVGPRKRLDTRRETEMNWERGLE